MLYINIPNIGAKVGLANTQVPMTATMETMSVSMNVSMESLAAFTNFSALLPVVGVIVAAILVISIIMSIGFMRAAY